MSEHRLPKRTLLLWQIRVTVITLIILGVLTYFCRGYGWYISSAVGLVALWAAQVIWYLPLLFKSYIIKYINGAVIIELGVIFKTTHIMPYSRLIYSQIINTPLARIMGLSAISLKAARSRVIIPEMNTAEVEGFALKLAVGKRK